MKKNATTIIIVLLGFIVATSCSVTHDDLLSSLTPKADFIRGNTLKFYYIDGQGKDLIDPNTQASLPVSLMEGEMIESDLGVNNVASGVYMYNRNWNTVSYDSQEGLYAFNTIIPGAEASLTYRFYIAIKNQTPTDVLDAEFYVTDKDVLGGGTYAFVKALYYNGKKVYSETDSHKWTDKIFIVKANGKTTVYLSRPQIAV